MLLSSFQTPEKKGFYLFCFLLYAMLPKGTGQRTHTINICSWMSKGIVAGRGPLPGPESGLSSNTRKWTVQGDTYADKARESIGKGSPSGEQEGKGTQENCSATWLEVGFYDDGISFQIVFNQSFWLRVLPGEQVHALFSQDGCIKKDSGRWLDMWCHFLTFPELTLLMVAY